MAQLNSKSVVKKEENTPFKELDHEGIILNLKNGDYFSVDRVGLLVWKAIDGKKNIDQIAGRVTARYEVSKDTALSDLIGFVKNLHQKELVEVLS